MKNFSSRFLSIAACLACLLNSHLGAQAPQAFNYQAVVRDNSGNVVQNQSVSLRFTIIDGSLSGDPVYRETDGATTNQFGLVTVPVGNGVVVSGDFSTINWAVGNKYLVVEMDASGGSNYSNM